MRLAFFGRFSGQDNRGRLPLLPQRKRRYRHTQRRDVDSDRLEVHEQKLGADDIEQELVANRTSDAEKCQNAAGPGLISGTGGARNAEKESQERGLDEK